MLSRRCNSSKDPSIAIAEDVNGDEENVNNTTDPTGIITMDQQTVADDGSRAPGVATLVENS